jgi:hypothetical protein
MVLGGPKTQARIQKLALLVIKDPQAVVYIIAIRILDKIALRLYD